MKWNAACRLATPLALMAMLAACGTDKPAAPPQATASASAAADAPPALPVVGEEMRIVALGDSLFAGYGVDPSQSYPARIGRRCARAGSMRR
jgi:acyl-CoA thioesterase-1